MSLSRFIEVCSLRVTVCSIFLEDLSNFVTKFQWDSAKYPIKQSLRNLTEIISKVCVVTDHPYMYMFVSTWKHLQQSMKTYGSVIKLS